MCLSCLKHQLNNCCIIINYEHCPASTSCFRIYLKKQKFYFREKIIYHSYKGHVGKTQRSICDIRETATFDKPTFSPKNATDRIKLKVGLVATTKEKTKDASMRRLLTLLPSVTFPTHILPYLESYQNVSPLCYWCAFSQCLVRNVLSRHNRKIASFIIRLHNHGDTWWPYVVLQQTTLM